jgi:hypothetical protein
MERSIHDALCVVKRVLESKSVVAGGGCVEAALSIYLENFATSLVLLNFYSFPSFSLVRIEINTYTFLNYRALENNWL